MMMILMMMMMCVGVVTRVAGGGSAAGTSSGSADGTGSAATFKHPYAITIDTMGVVYVADSDNHLIRMISPTGEVACSAWFLWIV